MQMQFTVVLENVDDDADTDVLCERIEIALAKEMPFIDAYVEYAE